MTAHPARWVLVGVGLAVVIGIVAGAVRQARVRAGSADGLDAATAEPSAPSPQPVG